MSDPNETIELSEQDEADLARLMSEPDGQEPPQFHTVLEVWREVLRPAAAEAVKKVTPAWASKIVQSYPEVTFADMEVVRDRYFGKIQELLELLEAEISADGDCLSYGKPEEDAEENAGHYRAMLREWQVRFTEWELAWTCTDPLAGAELAAISEVHKMFFGGPAQSGLVAFLDNIKFEYTEADQQELAEVLNELREASGE